MKGWQVLDALFPVCPWRRQAEKLARRTYKKDPGAATVTRYRFGWWVKFGDNPRCRFVHWGSGVVYYHTGAEPSQKATDAYFSRYPSHRKVTALLLPHKKPDSVALVRSIADLVRCDEMLPRMEWRQPDGQYGEEIVDDSYEDDPWFFGSPVAIFWLRDRFLQRGITSEVRKLARHNLKRAKLFRLSSLRMSLPDAFSDNGRMWHGQCHESLFEEVTRRYE